MRHRNITNVKCIPVERFCSWSGYTYNDHQILHLLSL